MGETPGSVWSEDGHAEGTFDQVKDHGRETCEWAKKHTDKQDGKVLEGERNRRERKRQRDVRTRSNKCGCTNDEESLSDERILK
jgi:hypothetical protein